MKYFKQFLGVCAMTLKGVDVTVVRKGIVLNSSQREMLAQPVSLGEVVDALKVIHYGSVPGIDGFGSYFYRKLWYVCGSDIFEVVKQFFESCIMYRRINIMSISLIPKTLHASSIRQFRPISCCSVLYKLVARILASRLQKVVETIVNPA